MGVNFNELRVLIRDGAKRAFTSVRDEHPDEQFYAFALYTDDGAMSLLPAANSEQRYQHAVENYGFTDERELKYLRWSTAEWAYEAFGNHFRAVDERFDPPDYDDPNDVAAFVAFQQQFHAAIVNALSDLDADGFFGTGDAREKVTVFVTISDSDEAERLERKSVRKLNPRPVYQRFIHRYS